MKTRRVLTRGQESAAKQLRTHAEEVATLTRRLREARRVRNLLIGKFKHAGFSVREIAALAGISNVRVSQVGK